MPQEQPSAIARIRQRLQAAAGFNAASDLVTVPAGLLHDTSAALASADEEIGELRKKLAAKEKTEEKPLAVFIEALQSMVLPSSYKEESRFKRAAEATRKLFFDNRADVKTVLWGDEHLCPVDIRDTAAVGGYTEIMSSAADFTPVMNYLAARAAIEPDNIVIVSGGDCYAELGTLNRMERLLKEKPKTSLDFVVMSDNEHTPVSKFARDLIAQFPAQVTVQTIGSGDSMTAALKAIAAKRTAQSPNPAVKPVGRPAPYHNRG